MTTTNTYINNNLSLSPHAASFIPPHLNHHQIVRDRVYDDRQPVFHRPLLESPVFHRPYLPRNSKLIENISKLTEYNYKLTEHNSTLTENNYKLTEHNSTLTENNYKLTEHNSKLLEDNSKLRKINLGLKDNISKLKDQNEILQNRINIIDNEKIKLITDNENKSKQIEELLLLLKTTCSLDKEIKEENLKLREKLDDIVIVQPISISENEIIVPTNLFPKNNYDIESLNHYTDFEPTPKIFEEKNVFTFESLTPLPVYVIPEIQEIKIFDKIPALQEIKAQEIKAQEIATSEIATSEILLPEIKIVKSYSQIVKHEESTQLTTVCSNSSVNNYESNSNKEGISDWEHLSESNSEDGWEQVPSKTIHVKNFVPVAKHKNKRAFTCTRIRTSTPVSARTRTSTPTPTDVSPTPTLVSPGPGPAPAPAPAPALRVPPNNVRPAPNVCHPPINVCPPPNVCRPPLPPTPAGQGRRALKKAAKNSAETTLQVSKEHQELKDRLKGNLNNKAFETLHHLCSHNGGEQNIIYKHVSMLLTQLQEEKFCTAEDDGSRIVVHGCKTVNNHRIFKRDDTGPIMLNAVAFLRKLLREEEFPVDLF